MSFHSYIPARFHPAFSLLGRFIQRRQSDRLRAESLYLLTSVLVGSGLVLSQTILWTFMASRSVDVFLAVGSQAGVALSFFLTCIVGWQPRIEVTVANHVLQIYSSGARICIPLSSIVRTSRIDAQLYYRHYRRHEQTLVFVNRIPTKLILLELDERPLVLGLALDDQRRLEKALATFTDSYHVA